MYRKTPKRTGKGMSRAEEDGDQQGAEPLVSHAHDLEGLARLAGVGHHSEGRNVADSTHCCCTNSRTTEDSTPELDQGEQDDVEMDSPALGPLCLLHHDQLADQGGESANLALTHS